MQNKKHEHLFIVYNPNSTGAATVEEQVFDPLDEQGIRYEVYDTKSPDTEENIADMQQIPSDADVIVAAGDGTAMQITNAAQRGKKDWTIGFTPHGNFSDQAYTHASHQHDVLDLLNAPTVDVAPMTIEVDGEYWRHAPSYMTIGWSAIAASQFGDHESRDVMKNTPKALKLARSLAQLAENYYKNRKTFLPPFAVNGDNQDNMTDIMAVNGPRVAGIIRSQDTYYDKPYFGAKADIDVSHILPNIPFGLKALSGHTPLERVESMNIAFEEAARIPVQTEGEFQWLDAQNIYVYKNPNDRLQIRHPKRTARA
ncbi:MAG TPA: diacylglycerol kinase family protein [Candidatus Saccharimonadales bacterium]|nr:diacylglycerol kinase family protein [Candidatus Saccharimonadales bacterium]